MFRKMRNLHLWIGLIGRVFATSSSEANGQESEEKGCGVKGALLRCFSKNIFLR